MTSPQLTTRRLALLSGFALLGVFGAASVFSAESPWRRPSARAPAPPYRVSIEDLDGTPLPTFRQDGSTFVLGAPGERYNIRVDNPTGERIEAVVTVDGRDAISGDVGDYVTSRGYLIEPWGSLLVEGFRRSLEEVAAFRFTGRAGSYSALRGTPQHVGVIGVAVFPEKLRPAPRPVWRPRPQRARSAANEAWDEEAPAKRREVRGSGSGASVRKSGPSNIGTEYGENESSSVVEVAFERRTPTHPAVVLSLRYDDYDGLQARGIDLSSLGYAYREPDPDPFPLSHSRFAPPPR